jgi:hypothetical protein
VHSSEPEACADVTANRRANAASIFLIVAFLSV